VNEYVYGATCRLAARQLAGWLQLEMGKNRHLLGSVLFGFFDCHGSVRVRVLLGNVTFISVIIYKLTINVFLKLQDC